MPGTFVFKPIEATIDNKANIGLHPENLDPYCKIKMGHVALSTHPSRNHGLHPHWNDDLVVQQGEDASCTVSVKDKNKGTIGEVKIDLDEIEARGKVAQWFDLYKDRKVQGQLLLEAVYTHANPQSRSWLLSAKEGAAVAGDKISVKGHHASPSEIGPFRVYERLRIPGQKNVNHIVKHNHDLTEARHHLGPNNIVAKYALEHMQDPQDHTGIKHQIEEHNTRVLNSGHKQVGKVLPREVVREDPHLSRVTQATNKDKADVKVHTGVNNFRGRPNSALQPTPVTYADANDVTGVAQHLGNRNFVDDGYVRVNKPILASGPSKVSHATPLETAEARQHVVPSNIINPNTKKVKIIDTAAPVNTKDVAEVVQHVGNYNVDPQNVGAGAFAGHSSLKHGQIRVQREDPATNVYPVTDAYVAPVVQTVDINTPGYPNAGYGHAGHSSLKNGHLRVQQAGPTVVYPNVVEDYVEDVNDVPVQQAGAFAGHTDNGYVRVQRGGPVSGCSYTYEDPNANYAEVINSPLPQNRGNAHAGHSSLKNGHVRVQEGPVINRGIPQVGIVPGSNWVNHTSDVYSIDRESVASSCTSCCSAYEGMSNPNNVGKSREHLKGLDRFNRVAEQERCLTCSDCGSIRSSVSSAKKDKDNLWYLNQIGMSDPNTAKLGVNHSANRLGLADQTHGHHHHHHHHHHGHHGGHTSGMKDRIVYQGPTLADINTLGRDARVYSKY